LAVAWFLLGIGMTMGLYDAAFAADRLWHEARRDHRHHAARRIASTIGWPASAWFEHAFGWAPA
jgi:hypothetical protein